MKKILLTSALLAVTTTPLVMADDYQFNSESASAKSSAYTELRRGGVFFGSAVAGAVLAGPIGMAVAAIGGVWLDEQVEKAAVLEAVSADLAVDLNEANSQIVLLGYQLDKAEQSSAKHAQLALDQLQLEMLFKTGRSELTLSGKQRLVLLADFMSKSPALDIQLDGYADPRGDAEYNLSLSAARVESVVTQLKTLGVASERISSFSHGASQSQSQQGDYDAYALERVVRIQLLNNKSITDKSSSVAQVTLSQ
ncbi:MAG: OmpA family protein [Spongiibacteraceae bacterium]